MTKQVKFFKRHKKVLITKGGAGDAPPPYSYQKCKVGTETPLSTLEGIIEKADCILVNESGSSFFLLI